MRRLIAIPLVLLSLSAIAQPQQRFSTGTMPPPQFEDPNRARKLAAAFPEIEKTFTEWVERWHVPGAILALIVDGDVVWSKAVGVRNVESGAPVNQDTLFRIASMTKSFTAMAILELRDEGKLRLDDPVARYLPQLAELPYPTRDSPPITVRDLLNHTEGFPEDNPWGDRQLAQTNATMDAWMRAGIPFSTAPGTSWEYSNYGFAILGRIVEEVSGVPYERYVRDNILRPLGMQRSTFNIPTENFAAGYRWEDEKWKPEPILEHGSFGAMGGLWTTMPELARYVSFLMSAFPARDEADAGPIRRSSAREMQQLWRTSSSTAMRRATDGQMQLRTSGYGYGLGVSADCRFAHIVGHGGGLPGYGSYMQWLPEYGVGFIGMANLTYTSPGRFMNDALDVLLRTGALKPRVPKPSPALLAAKNDVSRLIMKWDDDLAARVAADNLFPDRTAERRAAELRTYAERHGTCSAADTIEAENALRGRWRMNCERGWMNVIITLAPTTRPLVQFLNVDSVMPPSDAMLKSLNSTLDLAKNWKDDVLHKSADRAQMRSQLGALSHYGACRPGAPISGDGNRESVIEMKCERGDAYVRVTRDADSGQVTKLDVQPARGVRCSP